MTDEMEPAIRRIMAMDEADRSDLSDVLLSMNVGGGWAWADAEQTIREILMPPGGGPVIMDGRTEREQMRLRDAEDSDEA